MGQPVFTMPIPVKFTAKYDQLKYLCNTHFLAHLTLRKLLLKEPQPVSGGTQSMRVYDQMKHRTRNAVEASWSGNWVSLMTIMYLWNANTERVTMD